MPAFLRSVVERRGDARTIVLAKHDSFPCLSAYDPAYAALKHQKLERLLEKQETDPRAELDYARRTMMAFGATEEIPYDSSGRVILPPMMRRKGQIDDLALFIGVGETFQIWNPRLFLADDNVPDSDVYSLGATIWHLLVGRSPFAIPAGDNSTRALSARILHAAPPATQRPDVPPALDRLLQQCLAKRPEHRPASALELAQALQRIEEAAGWPRTAVAVEGDPQGGAAPPVPVPARDATVMKPVTVISASGPRRVAPTAPPHGAAEPARAAGGRTSTTVWAAVGVAVLGALVGGLFLMGGDDGEHRDDPGLAPDAQHTPTDVVPDVLTEAPTLSGRRTGEGVLFTWRPGTAPEPGDQWRWHRDDIDEFGHTTRRRLLVRTGRAICLDVVQVRGSDASPSARECVS